jgi:hypothetical protein
MVQMLGWFNADEGAPRDGIVLMPAHRWLCRPQEFQGNESAKRSILSFIDHAHPSATELVEDAVMRDGVTDHWAGMVGLQVVQVNEMVDVGRMDGAEW